MPTVGRREPAGSFNAMVRRRIRIESAKAVDADLKAWRREAYERA
jgi:hypothetical protein